MNRRTFLAAAALPAINGVRMGLETFSFHDLPPSGDPRLVPTIVANMRG